MEATPNPLLKNTQKTQAAGLHDWEVELLKTILADKPRIAVPELAKRADLTHKEGFVWKWYDTWRPVPKKKAVKKERPEPAISSPIAPTLDPANPFESAKQFISAHFEKRKLIFWQDDFLTWDDTAYREISAADLRSNLYVFLNDAVTPDRQPFKPTRNRVSDVLDALKAAANLPDSLIAPTWMDGRGTPNPAEIIACKNGLLHLPTRQLYQPDPAFFNLNSLDFPFNPTAPQPQHWLTFLEQLWKDDRESIDTLQEIFGYLLTGDTTQQKIFLFVGPMRSGKGTIARILTSLIGQANTCGPTLSGLSNHFGLAALIGKQLAVISDARLGGKADQSAIAERLLSISGEDAISIPRKFKQDFTAKLPTRFVILTNELPRLADASGALASRFVVLTLRNSFLGKEDPGLTARLLLELPSILNWAICGWERLRKRGYFIQPQASREAVQELADLSSPISAFVRDCCDIGPALEIETDKLYEGWREWCETQGRDRPGTKQTFARDLKAAQPAIATKDRMEDGRRFRVFAGVGTKLHAITRVESYCSSVFGLKDNNTNHSREYNAFTRVESRVMDENYHNDDDVPF